MTDQEKHEIRWPEPKTDRKFCRHTCTWLHGADYFPAFITEEEKDYFPSKLGKCEHPKFKVPLEVQGRSLPVRCSACMEAFPNPYGQNDPFPLPEGLDK